MLNWWLGRPVEGNRVEDESREQEPPETPAPVFAARALKSAIFGTPAPPDDDTLYEIERELGTMSGNDVLKSQPRSLSPTKPPGILLTPGTATTRRKTVSFGNEVVEKDEDKTGAAKGTGRSGLPDDCPGKFPSPWVQKTEESTKSSRKTTLIKSLENAREGKTTKLDNTRTSSESHSLPTLNSGPQNNPSSESDLGPRRTNKSQKSNQDSMQDLVEKDNFDGDMTMDLNQPHSQSGRFWKSEYEHYHEQAKEEMKKLLSYKQLAKSYAKMKDSEAIDLAEKLKEEQQKVNGMEEKISELSAQIVLCGSDDESPQLIKDLARQTALAIQYKTQVEEFRAALEGTESKASGLVSRGSKRRNSHRTDESQIETRRELKKALKEIASLRDEVHDLRQKLTTAERTTMKLQEENGKLAQELLHADLRLETHLERCEKKRRASDEHRQKRDEVMQNLQNDYDKLKDLAKTQRRDAEHLLKKRHDQVVELKKEIASMRGADSAVQDFQLALQQKSVRHDQAIADYQKQIEELKGKQGHNSREDVQSLGNSKDRKQDNLPSESLSKPLPSNDISHMRESQIPVSSQSISRPSKVLVPVNRMRAETPVGSPRHRSSHSALSEIINNSTADAQPFQRSGPVQHTPQIQLTPLTNRFSSMSLESPEMQLPSPEPSLPHISTRAIHERNCQPSPRPSMFNIASSPPKAAMVRPRVSNELQRQRSNNELGSRRHANITSSRLSSLEGSRTRNSIPPERAAAAKARLEQKQAEKKRAKLLGADKENVQN